MSARWFDGLMVLGLVLLAAPAVADPERRVALIIGNDSYKSMKRLDNGANDARAIEHELKSAGFETTLKVNAGRKDMHAAINEFGGKLASGSVGLFYYAGHGIQSGDKNFLVPVDADLQSEDDLESDAIDVGKVMRVMEAARNKLNVVVLDACRDNPLPKGGRSGSRGLAVIPAPTGTLVAYATGPGKIAQDGDRGGNGVYTGELVKALRQPGLNIEDVFKTTAARVMERTGGKQVPWMQASVTGNFYFRPPGPGTSAPSPAVAGGGNQAEIVFWQSIKDSKDPFDFKAYLEKYPGGEFTTLARNRLDKLKGPQTSSVAPSAPAVTQRNRRTWTATEPDMVLGEVIVQAEKILDKYTLHVSGTYPLKTEGIGNYIKYWSARWNGSKWIYGQEKGSVDGSWEAGDIFSISFDVPARYIDDFNNSNVRLCLDAGTGCWPSPNLVPTK